MSKQRGLNAYQQIKAHSSVEDASPYQLVQLLLIGAVEKINLARGHIQNQKVGPKGECISLAISILGGLQASLDLEAEAPLAKNLNDLYEYCKIKLFEANVKNDIALLDEVLKLIETIKEGWEGMDLEARKIVPTKTNRE